MTATLRGTARVIAACTLATLMTGCVKVDLNMQLHGDNTVSGTMVFAVSRNLLALTGSSADDLLGQITASAGPLPAGVGFQQSAYADDRFDWQTYYDPDPQARDKIYSRWGGFIDPVPFDRELIDIRLSYGLHYREHPTENIVRDAVYPVCAPGLAGTIKPEGPAGLPLIHTDWGPTGAAFPSWRNWFEAAGIDPGRAAQRGLSANSSRAALDLAISGLGVALAQGIYCAAALEDGRLVRPVARALDLRQPYCLTIPERSARRDVVAAFREWLMEECRRAVESPALISAPSPDGS